MTVEHDGSFATVCRVVIIGWTISVAKVAYEYELGIETFGFHSIGFLSTAS